MLLRRIIHKCVLTARYMHILFHEQVVCRKGTTMEKAYLMKKSIITTFTIP